VLADVGTSPANWTQATLTPLAKSQGVARVPLALVLLPVEELLDVVLDADPELEEPEPEVEVEL
jgi:hypothetical protein